MRDPLQRLPTGFVLTASSFSVQLMRVYLFPFVLTSGYPKCNSITMQIRSPPSFPGSPDRMWLPQNGSIGRLRMKYLFNYLHNKLTQFVTENGVSFIYRVHTSQSKPTFKTHVILYNNYFWHNKADGLQRDPSAGEEWTRRRVSWCVESGEYTHDSKHT